MPSTPLTHHHMTPSCVSVNSDCSFFSADESLHALDLEGCSDIGDPRRRRRSRIHTRSRSLESFSPRGSALFVDCETRDVPEDGFLGTEEQLDSGTEIALGLSDDPKSTRPGGVVQGRPVVPPLPLHRLSKFKATISVEISQDKSHGFKGPSTQLGLTNAKMTKGVSTSVYKARSQTQLFGASKHVSTRSPVKRGHSRFRGLQCFSVNPLDDRTPRMEGDDSAMEKRGQTEHDFKGRGSRSFPARLGSMLTSLRDRGTDSNGPGVKLPNKGWRSIKSWRKRRSKEAANRSDDGDVWSDASSNLEINVGVQLEKYQVASLCPSIPGTDTKQFTARGPNVSWVDEDFFDCDENWEMLLAPLGATDQPVNLSNADENGRGASLVAPANKPARPHRLRGSVEDVVPIYTPLTSVAELDGKNKTQFGYISARKVLLPGLATIPRKDEVGIDVKTLEELQMQMNGSWERVPQESDDPSILCDVMELPWIYKRALSLSSQTEVWTSWVFRSRKDFTSLFIFLDSPWMYRLICSCPCFQFAHRFS